MTCSSGNKIQPKCLHHWNINDVSNTAWSVWVSIAISFSWPAKWHKTAQDQKQGALAWPLLVALLGSRMQLPPKGTESYTFNWEKVEGAFVTYPTSPVIQLSASLSSCSAPSLPRRDSRTCAGDSTLHKQDFRILKITLIIYKARNKASVFEGQVFFSIFCCLPANYFCLLSSVQ